MEKSNSIDVIVQEGFEESISVLPRIGGHGLTTVRLPFERIKQSRGTFLESIDELIEESDRKDSKLQIGTIEFNPAINAEGGVELIGKASAGVTSSIRVVLRRSDRSAK